MSEQTAVTTDTGKDAAVTIYLIVLGLVGVGLIVAGAMLDWGGYAYGGGGFLVLAGFGGLVGKKMEGGFGEAPCPAGCGASLKFQFTKSERTMQCEGCGAWAHGTETMALVEDDHMASYPVFTTPMPADGVAWPEDATGHPVCPMCDGPSSGLKKIEGSDALGMTAAMVSPVSVRKIHSIKAPICPEHDDGVALFVSGSDLSLGFRSRAYQLRFEALNS